MSMMSKVIKGRGKILFYDEKDREKMNKKYPDIEFEKMNALTFTTTYKGNKQFEVEIQVGDTKIPCSIQKWAEPWKYGTKVELRLYFKDLKKKATTHITGGIQNQLFKFFRYDYEKMMKDDPKLNKKVSKKTKKKEKPQIIMVEYSKGKAIRKVYNVDNLSSKQKKKKQKGGKKKRKTFKSEKKKENIDYWKCIKQNENTQKCNNKRGKKLKYLEKKYPKEWSQYQNDFQTNPKLKY